MINSRFGTFEQESETGWSVIVFSDQKTISAVAADSIDFPEVFDFYLKKILHVQRDLSKKQALSISYTVSNKLYLHKSVRSACCIAVRAAISDLLKK